jgi:hypothetical protein
VAIPQQRAASSVRVRITKRSFPGIHSLPPGRNLSGSCSRHAFRQRVQRAEGPPGMLLANLLGRGARHEDRARDRAIR